MMAFGQRHAILVVGPAWVGDMVMAQSLFMTLKLRWPDSRIDLLVPPWGAPLLTRMPEVSEVIELPLGHGQFKPLTRLKIGRRLARRRYDQAIVLPRSWKSALVPFAAGIPQRTGYRGEWRHGLLNDIRPLDKHLLTQTVQRFVALGLAPGAAKPPYVPQPALQVDKRNQAMLIRRLGLELDVGRGAVALAPGAEYGPAKQWPPEYFRGLAKRLIADGKAVWVLGSPKERALGERICRGVSGPIRNLCGQTSLTDTVDLFALCRRLVTNDSGLMHVGAAAGTELVALYGSSSPGYTPPLSAHADVVYLRLHCSPCFQRVCPLGHNNCLRQISVDDVHQRCLDAG